MLTPTEAADIARRSGLSLSDAVALRMLADDKAEAETLAARFVTEPDAGAFAANLLGGVTEPAIEPEPTDAETEDRAAARAIFGPGRTTTGGDAA